MLNIVAGLENVFRFLGACFMVNSFVRDKANMLLLRCINGNTLNQCLPKDAKNNRASCMLVTLI